MLGLVASVLVVFTFMTQMHERYAYAALVLLVVLLPTTRVRQVWLAFGALFTLNLVAAIPPTPTVGALLPIDGPLGIAGSLGMAGLTVALLVWVTVRRNASHEGP